MAETARNAPCPCGSGKKYKHCHLGVEEEQKTKVRVGPIIAGVVLGIGAGVGGYFWKGPMLGFAIGSAAFILVLIGASIGSPPPPGAGGDPGAINFGSK